MKTIFILFSLNDATVRFLDISLFLTECTILFLNNENRFFLYNLHLEWKEIWPIKWWNIIFICKFWKRTSML